MKNFRKIFLILVLTFIFNFSVFAEEDCKLYLPAGSRQTRANAVQPVIECPTSGFLTPATPTIDLGVGVATSIGELPTGTKQVRLYAFNGAVAYGDYTISSSTALTYPVIASGTLSESISVSTTTPGIYVIGVGGSATIRLMPR